MKRRSFLKFIATSSLSLAGGLKVLAEILPERIVEAVRRRGYPGRIRRIDYDKISKPGKWLG